MIHTNSTIDLDVFSSLSSIQIKGIALPDHESSAEQKKRRKIAQFYCRAWPSIHSFVKKHHRKKLFMWHVGVALCERWDVSDRKWDQNVNLGGPSKVMLQNERLNFKFIRRHHDSMPSVYPQGNPKYSWLTWCNAMKSFRSLHLLWYCDLLAYIRWIIAVTLPNTTACIKAGSEEKFDKKDAWIRILRLA